jgi:hypothetical protein
MVAEHGVDWAFEARTYARHPGERCVVWTTRSASVVTRQNANVIACLSDELDRAFHCGFAHLDMKVAEVSDGESVEGAWQVWRLNPIVPYVNLCRIANASMIEARHHKDGADYEMRQRQVLEVKEVYALTKDLSLMVLLDFQALSRVQRPQALL